jgi:hypothetical protein
MNNDVRLDRDDRRERCVSIGHVKIAMRRRDDVNPGTLLARIVSMRELCNDFCADLSGGTGDKDAHG